MILWDYAVCVFSEWKNSTLGLTPDAHGDQPSAVPYNDIQPLGLRSRPRDPDAGPDGKPTLGAGLLTALLGHLGFAMPTTDPRALTRIPPAKKGGTCLHSTGPVVGFLNIDGETGTMMQYVPYSLDGDGNPQKSLVISIDTSTSGQENIQIRHGEGHGITIMKDAKNSIVINNKAGDACIIVDDDGITLNGNVKINGGVVLGDIAGAQPLVMYPQLATFVTQTIAAFSTLLGGAGSTVPAFTVPSAVPAPTTKVSGS